MMTTWDLFVLLSFIYFVAVNLAYTVLTLASFVQSGLRVKQAGATNFDLLSKSRITPPISILVPAHNEEPMIVTSISTALSVNYPEFEIIVINDGSKDRTLRKMIEAFDMVGSNRPYRATFQTAHVRRIYQSRTHPNLFIIDKENGGKADALNAGINLSRYRYVCNTDADSMFERDSLLRVMRHVVRDPRRVMAAGGQIRIGNGFKVAGGEIVDRKLPDAILPKFQIVEYLRTFLGNRVGWSSANAMMLISGAFAVWRRDALVSVGGFNPHITGEDLEVTMRFHSVMRRRKEEYAIVALPDPVCWTEAPEDVRSFYQQRNRWHRVLLESYWTHREMLFNREFGTVGLLGMPYYLLFEIFGPFMELISYFAIIGFFGIGALRVETMILFLMLSIGYTTFLNILSILIEEVHYTTYGLADTLRLIMYAFVDSIGYRQLSMAIRVIATFDWLSRTQGWGTITRRGYEHVEAAEGGEAQAA